MNVLIVTNADLLGVGGLNTRYRELSKAIGTLNNSVFLLGVVYSTYHSLHLGKNVKVHPLDMSLINRFKAANIMLSKILWAFVFAYKCTLATLKIFSTHHIDFCLSFALPADSVIYLLSRLFRVFWVYDCRGLFEREMSETNLASGFINRFLLCFEKFSSKHADEVLVVSEEMKRTIIALRNLDASKIAVSEDGIDPSKFNPFVSKGLAREALGLPEECPLILYVGSISMAKGIDRLIEAMLYILEKCPTAKLVIVGGGGYYVNDFRSLQKMVKDLGLDESVMFTGRVKHPAPFIVDADVCVAPSSFYFSPIKIYEYLACARPVVMDKNVDIAELLVTNEAGMAADTTNPCELASIIVRLLNNKDFSQKISLHGYRIVVDNFTWKQTARKLVKVIQSASRRTNKNEIA